MAGRVLDRAQLKPIDWPDLVRLGAPSDGGYVVPTAQVKQATVLLSLGIKYDWSFEKAFIAVNEAAVTIIGVDPSVGPASFARRAVANAMAIVREALAGRRKQRRKAVAAFLNSLDYFRFFGRRHRHIRKAVSGTDSDTEVTLATLLASAGHTGQHRAFLKMDIEGAEYGVIPDIVRSADRIGAMVAEFHRVNRNADAMNLAIAELLRHFWIVHIHGNNYGGCDEVNGFPDFVEITFVNKAVAAAPAVPVSRVYPVPGLDFPNLPTRPDYPLRFD